MAALKIYTEDLEIAKSLINRDENVTRVFFYKQCYPLFKSIYDNYYTDCINCKEFIDEIYIIALAPNKSSGKCQMENYKGESTLTCWLKTVCLYYCYNKYELKQRMPVYEPLPLSIDNRKDDEGCCDRFDGRYGSMEIDFNNLSYQDFLIIIEQMPNERYQKLIRLRYVEHLSNEETAETLGMTMANYYNKHKLAKAQFLSVSRKEASHG